AAHGVDPAVMIDILNVSTGRNTATTDKFPRQILTEAYAAGFSSSLLLKDLRLCDAAARHQPAAPETSWTIGPAVLAAWERFEADQPGADVTRIYPFVRSGR